MKEQEITSETKTMQLYKVKCVEGGQSFYVVSKDITEVVKTWPHAIEIVLQDKRCEVLLNK